MIEEHARVIALDEQGVWVETQRRSACGQCSVNNSCGTALLAKVLGVKRNKVCALNPEATNVSIGDEVIIGVSEHALTRGSLAVYTVPLLALFVFSLLGENLAQQLSISNEDAITIAFGMLGLLAGFLWVKRFSRVVSNDPNYQPVLLRRLSSPIPINFQS